MWLPCAHVAEHSPQSPQVLNTQFTGHECVLHTLVSISAPHDMPPHSAERSTVRVRILDPVLPQRAEHEPQLDHAETWQFTGQQDRTTQGVTCCVAAHVPPHVAFTVIWRVRILVPLPHDLLHVE